MARDDDNKGEFWRGYVWGLFTPPLIGAGLTIITVGAAAVIAATTKRQPGDVLRDWREGSGGEEIPPPGPGPIDVEATERAR